MSKAFKIRKKDIKEYFNRTKESLSNEDSLVLYLRYLRECDYFSKENLEILLKKYNGIDVPTEGIYTMDDNARIPVKDYNWYKNNCISNLDITGITHIAIPLIKKYNLCGKSLNIDTLDDAVLNVADYFEIVERSPYEKIDKAINDYETCGMISLNRGNKMFNGSISIFMNENTYNRELNGLSSYYEKDYTKVKEIIKERM